MIKVIISDETDELVDADSWDVNSGWLELKKGDQVVALFRPNAVIGWVITPEPSAETSALVQAMRDRNEQIMKDLSS